VKHPPERVLENQQEQMENRGLFFSVFLLACGIISFFALPFSVYFKFPIVILFLSMACFYKYRWPLFLFIFGFCYAGFRTELVDTKLLTYNKHNVDISGVIQNIDYSERNKKLLLETPDHSVFKISVPNDADCKIGGTAVMRTNLYAQKPSDAFNKFDYARWSFFNGMSGTGKASNVVCNGGEYTLRDKLHFIADNKLADTLVFGYKNAIPKSEYDNIKTAGISHVISISGFHLALMGGWIFFILNFIIKLFPAWTKRYPSRNIALPLTLVGLFSYLMLSGNDVATIRSFVMVGLGFLAMTFRRKILTIRNAALVFGLMILIQPFWLVSAGFQLSFAAVFGLLYFFDRHKIPDGKINRFFYVLVATSVVAIIWTMPFVLYHFGTFPLYSLVGNLILLPIFSVAIMPVVMVGVITSLFGFHGPFIVSDYLYKFVLDISGHISSLPFSMVSFGDISGMALFLVFCGMFWYLMGKKKIAVVFFSVSAVIVAFTRVPVLRTTADNEVVGFIQNGQTYFNVGYSENNPFIIPYKTEYRHKCIKGICTYKTEKWTAISIQKFMPIYNNIDKLCDGDFIISYLPLELPKCQEKVLPGGAKIYSDGKIEFARPRNY
jgi:competence protein ComEC